MNPRFDKSQFAEMAESPETEAPFFAMGMEAAIADSDFRTYVLLCQLACQEQPHAPSPWTERTYAELAALHPSHRSVRAETVRGRLNRLASAGLITRQRSGQSTWRTYPVLDGPLFVGSAPTASVRQSLPQSQPPIHLTLHLTLEAGANGYQARLHPAGTPGWVGGAHPDLSALTHWMLGDTPSPSDPRGQAGSETAPSATHPDPAGRAPATHPEAPPPGEKGGQTAARHTHPAPSACVPGTHPDPRGKAGRATAPSATHPQTQGQASGRVAETQTAPAQEAALPSGCVVDAHPAPSACVPATHPAPVEQETSPARRGADQPALAPTALGGDAAHTQTIPGRVPGAHPDQRTQPLTASTPAGKALGVLGAHTQTAPTTSGCVPGTHPEAPHTHVRARVSTDPDLSTDSLSVKNSSQKKSDQSISTDHPKGRESVKQAGPGATPAPAQTSGKTAQESTPPAPQHPVLERLRVPPALAELAVTLATLAPQGMNYEGIEECLQTPEMTRVWLDYVTTHPEEVRSPAAYIRRGVRSGNKPLVRTSSPTPQAAPPAAPAPGQDEWDGRAFGWNDPSIPEAIYKKYVFLNSPEAVEAARLGARQRGTHHA